MIIKFKKPNCRILAEKVQDSWLLKVPNHPGFKIVSPTQDPWERLWQVKARSVESKRLENRMVNGFKLTLAETEGTVATHELQMDLRTSICRYVRSGESNIHSIFSSVHVFGPANFQREWLTVTIRELFETES